MIYVVISKSCLNVCVHGKYNLLGPCGLLAIEEEHCPSWLQTEFTESKIECEDHINEIADLISKGYATVISSTRYMHVPKSSVL